MVLLLAGI